MTETVDLYVIARLEAGVAVADIYCCEVFYDAATGSLAGRGIEGWWESVATTPEVPASLDALGEVLTANGYTRTTNWRQKVTASGAIRYFTDATARIDD
ncbi:MULTISPECIES: hypothetical protein [unclassified Nocardia]|uniref:hypothetical protein n=1 Tax=unclassified Nocardia TaxID=2637762 RepID=UPI00278C109F|nr:MULTISPECIES: hypothetical protein [unclassified Nocardia]